MNNDLDYKKMIFEHSLKKSGEEHKEKHVWSFKEADVLSGMNTKNSHADLLAPLLESEIN